MKRPAKHPANDSWFDAFIGGLIVVITIIALVIITAAFQE